MSGLTDRTILGARLKEAREYRGYSQEEIAKYLGIPRSAISLIETGDRRTDVLELRRLATLYGCAVGELTGEDGETSHTDEVDPSTVQLVARATAKLSKEDISEVLRFAQFLQSRNVDKGK